MRARSSDVAIIPHGEVPCYSTGTLSTTATPSPLQLFEDAQYDDEDGESSWQAVGSTVGDEETPRHIVTWHQEWQEEERSGAMSRAGPTATGPRQPELDREHGETQRQAEGRCGHANSLLWRAACLTWIVPLLLASCALSSFAGELEVQASGGCADPPAATPSHSDVDEEDPAVEDMQTKQEAHDKFAEADQLFATVQDLVRQANNILETVKEDLKTCCPGARPWLSDPQLAKNIDSIVAGCAMDQDLLMPTTPPALKGWKPLKDLDPHHCSDRMGRAGGLVSQMQRDRERATKLSDDARRKWNEADDMMGRATQKRRSVGVSHDAGSGLSAEEKRATATRSRSGVASGLQLADAMQIFAFLLQLPAVVFFILKHMLPSFRRCCTASRRQRTGLPRRTTSGLLEQRAPMLLWLRQIGLVVAIVAFLTQPWRHCIVEAASFQGLVLNYTSIAAELNQASTTTAPSTGADSDFTPAKSDTDEPLLHWVFLAACGRHDITLPNEEKSSSKLTMLVKFFNSIGDRAKAYLFDLPTRVLVACLQPVIVIMIIDLVLDLFPVIVAAQDELAGRLSMAGGQWLNFTRNLTIAALVAYLGRWRFILAVLQFLLVVTIFLAEPVAQLTQAPLTSILGSAILQLGAVLVMAFFSTWHAVVVFAPQCPYRHSLGEPLLGGDKEAMGDRRDRQRLSMVSKVIRFMLKMVSVKNLVAFLEVATEAIEHFVSACVFGVVADNMRRCWLLRPLLSSAGKVNEASEGVSPGQEVGIVAPLLTLLRYVEDMFG